MCSSLPYPPKTIVEEEEEKLQEVSSIKIDNIAKQIDGVGNKGSLVKNANNYAVILWFFFVKSFN